MPPSILKALFVLLFLFGFLIVTQPRSIMRMPNHFLNKIIKKDNNLDKNDLKIF